MVRKIVDINESLSPLCFSPLRGEMQRGESVNHPIDQYSYFLICSLLGTFKKLSELHKAFDVLHNPTTFSLFKIEEESHQVQTNEEQQKAEETLENSEVVCLKT
jgi:hypothetical protein